MWGISTCVNLEDTRLVTKYFFFDAAGRWRCGLCGREVPRPRGSRDLSLSKVDWEDSGGDM